MIDFWNPHQQKWADCEQAMRTEGLFTSLTQGHLVAQVHWEEWLVGPSAPYVFHLL